EKPYDIYLHQILSKVMQRGSARPGVIFGELAAVESYRAITAAEFDGILESLVIHELIKKENGMITLSRGFEKRFSGMNFISFYSVFESEKQFSVLENTTRVGSLDSHFVMNGLNAGDKFMLGGRKYVAMDIDLKKGVIQARRVDSGRAPRWRSEPVACEYDVIAEMHRVLGSCGGRGASGGEIEKLRAVMDSCANERFDELVRAASASGIDGGGIYLWPDEALNEVKILTFGSAYVNNVIRALLTAAFPGTKVTSSCPASLSVAPPPLLQTRAFAARLGEFIEKIPDIMRSKPEILMKSAAASGMIKPVRGKFAAYLPADLHDRLFMMKYFEPETACAHIRKHSVTSLSRPDILNEINL
nr:hypothetical protein [Candidatus Wallbacteria bacterium]